MKLIKNASVHDGLGNILVNTDIRIKDGLIDALGENLDGDGCEVVDAAGKEIFPGFIDPCNKWGAAGPELRDNDMNEHTDPVSPQLNVIYAFDHEGMVFQNAFQYGVSSMGLMPSFANVLGGQAAVYSTYGTHPYDMIIKEKAAMAASASVRIRNIYGKEGKPPKTTMGIMAMMDTAFQKALSHDGTKDYDPKSEALIPVLKGEMPLFVNAEETKEMDSIELFMSKYPQVKYIFCGAFGLRKDRLSVATGNVGAIIGDRVSTSGEPKVKYKHIKKLLEGGAVIALGDCTENGGSKENTLWNAILCCQKGIEPEAVLQMITLNPAKLLGVDNMIGSIEKGKRADFSIWSKNPLISYNAKIERMYIGGLNVLDKEVRLTCW